MIRSAIFLFCVFGLALGCAHSHDKFYFENGSICAEMKSTVIGTGEASKRTTGSKCGAILAYDTKDTGVSDNATELGGKVAEGLARGAVEGLVPGP